MPQFIWVSRAQIAPGADISGVDGPSAVFVVAGTVAVGGQTVDAGQGAFRAANVQIANRAGDPAMVLVFGWTDHRPDVDTLSCEQVADLATPRLLRLDEVAFPPGAIAYRHTHPGPGFRYLRHGALQLQADDHAFGAAPGEVWFEPADSPVRATADAAHAETRFVRFMVLPPAFLGKPTIKILDPNDAARPKRQTTHRHVDQILGGDGQVDAG